MKTFKIFTEENPRCTLQMLIPVSWVICNFYFLLCVYRLLLKPKKTTIMNATKTYRPNLNKANTKIKSTSYLSQKCLEFNILPSS